MKISIIGSGRWGSFIGWYLNSIGHDITFYGAETSRSLQQLKRERSNGIITLKESVKFTHSLEEALNAEAIVISIPSQALRGLLTEIKSCNFLSPSTKFILCMKGIEIESGMRLTEVFRQVLGEAYPIAVWLGPGHIQEFVAGVPNCMVIDSIDPALKESLIQEFSGPLIRFYIGMDLIGNEIGAAAKNVIGIAAGILDGINKSSMKGALMSRGTREISRLILACGGNELSAYGLCHLGDYEATVFSKYSHNRSFGECLATHQPYNELAEGYFTAKALWNLAHRLNIELPICFAVYRILYENADVEQELNLLFYRSLKQEF